MIILNIGGEELGFVISFDKVFIEEWVIILNVEIFLVWFFWIMLMMIIELGWFSLIVLLVWVMLGGMFKYYLVKVVVYVVNDIEVFMMMWVILVGRSVLLVVDFFNIVCIVRLLLKVFIIEIRL